MLVGSDAWPRAWLSVVAAEDQKTADLVALAGPVVAFAPAAAPLSAAAADDDADAAVTEEAGEGKWEEASCCVLILKSRFLLHKAYVKIHFAAEKNTVRMASMDVPHAEVEGGTDVGLQLASPPQSQRPF